MPKFFKELWEYEKAIHVASMKIAERYLPFPLAFGKVLVAFITLLVGSTLLYLFFGGGPVQENILYLSAIPVVAIVAYLLARTWAPVELEREYLRNLKELQKEKAILVQRLESQFAIIVVDDRIAPYFQVVTRTECDPILQTEQKFDIQVCRLAIQNIDGRDIPNTQVKLIGIEPFPDGFGGLDLPLHFMHDNAPPYRDSITLTAGNTVYVDIAALILGRAPFFEGPLMIEHIIPSIRKNIPEGEYRLTIQVTGSDTTKVVKGLCIWTEYTTERAGLYMKMLDDQDATKS